MAVAMGVPTPISIHAPREGGDAGPRQGFPPPCISIHAPREGGDILGGKKERRRQYFNPRPPRGGRRISTDVNSAK